VTDRGGVEKEIRTYLEKLRINAPHCQDAGLNEPIGIAERVDRDSFDDIGTPTYILQLEVKDRITCSRTRHNNIQ